MKAFEIANFSTLLSEAAENAEIGWEEDFVTSLQEKFWEYDDDMFVSPAQLERLEKIAGLKSASL